MINIFYKNLPISLFSLLLIIVGSFIIQHSFKSIFFIDHVSKNNHFIYNLKKSKNQYILSKKNFYKNNNINLNQLVNFNSKTTLKNFYVYHDQIDNIISKPVNSSNYDLEVINLSRNNINTNINIKSLLNNELYSIENAKTKKEKFILSILPYIAYENQQILANRSRIIEVQKFLNAHKTLSKNEQLFIDKLSLEYGIKTTNKHKIDIIDILLKRVDVVPNSIVLAQAAIESGWGTSRFAKDYNALFGEYTYNIENGVTPSLRDKGKKHLVKFFPSVHKSIQSYLKNINTHNAYVSFRQTRKYLRENNIPLQPEMLANQLSGYAEDLNYVKTIRSVIKVNQLKKFDNIILVPFFS